MWELRIESDICIILSSSVEQVQEFNDFFTRGIFDIAEPLDQSWINLKRVAAAPPPPTDTETFGRVMERCYFPGADIDPDPNSDLGAEDEESDDDEMKFGMMMMLFFISYQ